MYIQGEKQGSLSIRKEGAYYVLSADCEYRDGIMRLYIFGNGKKALFGTPKPSGGRLHLEKKLSRREFETLPNPIEYAADAELRKQNDRLWYEMPDGTLYSDSEGHRLIAIPCSERLGRNLAKTISGKTYMIFHR